MNKRIMISGILLTGAGLLAGCAESGMSGTNLATSSVAPAQAMAAKVDPACVALSAKIETLRKDGVAERVEKAAAGKAKTVSVKRDSLVKMTELDKANAEFQGKCSTIAPKPAQTAAVAPAAAAPAPPVAAAVPAPVPAAAAAAKK